MFLLILLGFICALSLLVPTTFVPVYVKWPIAFAVVILITVIFNAKKKDTLYLTKEIKSKSVKRGLFHPMMNYAAYALLLTAFLSIYEIAKVNGINDLITDFSKLIGLIAGLDKLLICALLLLVISLLVSAVFKWVLSNCADTTTLKERGFLYIVLTVTTSVSLIYAALNCDLLGFNEFMLSGNNPFVFFGFVGLFVIIDFIIFIVSCNKSKKAKKGLVAKESPKKITKEEKKARKAEKRHEKAVKALEKDLAKKQAKIDKKLTKLNDKIQNKNAKIETKLAKKVKKTTEEVVEESVNEPVVEATEVVNEEAVVTEVVAEEAPVEETVQE